MKPITQMFIAGILTIAFSQVANACVSAGYSPTCNKDCSDWNGILYEVCIYGSVSRQ